MMGILDKLAAVLPGGRDATPEERLLKSTGLFSKLGSDELLELCRKLSVAKYAAGERIFEEGALGDAFYAIRSGTVRISTLDEDGREIVLARLEGGEYFGEQALLDDTPTKRNASAVAISEVEALRLSHADFQRVLDSSRKLEQALREHGTQQFVEKWTRQRGVFGAIDGKLIEGVSRNVRDFEPGTMIFAQGDPSDGVYFITEGQVRIVIDDGSGASPKEALLGAGQMFGERGVLRQEKRAGSAIARGPVRALFFDKRQFRKVYDASPELEQWARDVQSIYEIPKRGIVSIHEGEYLGMECVTSLFQLEDGRSVTTSKVLGQEIFILAEAGAPTGRELVWKKDQFERKLSIADGRIVAIVSTGYWPELSKACGLALDGTVLEEWRESLFRTAGVLEVTEPDQGHGPTVLLCNCMRVPRGKVRQAIDDGCTQLAAVSAATGAGTVCGGCRPKISAMLGNTTWEPVRIEEVVERSPGVRSYRLKPFAGGIQPYEAGQHLVIQSLIDERFVARSYTLTSAPAGSDCYEITVKREEQGYFSRWLFEHGAARPFLRVAAPGGAGIHTLVGSAPIVCLVAGIGITPAVALARHLADAENAQRVHIDYSASTRQDLVFADELQAICARQPGISLNLRVTSEAGRLTTTDVTALAKAHDGAAFFICGSRPYHDMVSSALASAGVPPARVVSEEFTHAGASS